MEIKNENVVDGIEEVVKTEETNKFAGIGKWILAGVTAVAAVAVGVIAFVTSGNKEGSDDSDDASEEAADEDFEDINE